jgi:hypothetical protein
MGRFIAAGLAAALILTSVASTGFAAPAKYQNFDFDADVPGLPGRTWLDLLQQAFPAIKADANRQAQGDVANTIPLMPGDREQGGDKSTIDLSNLDAARIEIDGKPRWVVVGEQDSFGLAPLMLFEADGAGKLLDVVDVCADMHTSMDNAGPLPLGGGVALIGVRGWRDSSDRFYDDLKLVLIAKDRFSLIGNLSGSGERQARFVTTEYPLFSISLDARRPLARIDVVLERQKQNLAEDGETKIGKPIVTRAQTMYRWNSASGRYDKSIYQSKFRSTSARE